MGIWMSEQPFRKTEIEILKNTARFGATTYQIANISLVRVQYVKKLNPMAVALFVFGAATLWAVVQIMENQDPAIRWYAGLAGIALVVGSVAIQSIWPKKEFTFSLRVNSGDWEKFVTTDREYALKVKDEIEYAFQARS